MAIPLHSKSPEPMPSVEQVRLPRRVRRAALLAPELVVPALKQSFVMLRPDIQWANPVMFVVEVGAFLTLLFIVQMLVTGTGSQVPLTYFVALDLWLWATVLFANFATALAEARGQAQAESLGGPGATRRRTASTRTARSSRRRRPSSGWAIWWSWKRTRSSRVTVRSSRASRRSTNPRSPVSRRR